MARHRRAATTLTQDAPAVPYAQDPGPVRANVRDERPHAVPANVASSPAPSARPAPGGGGQVGEGAPGRGVPPHRPSVGPKIGEVGITKSTDHEPDGAGANDPAEPSPRAVRIQGGAAWESLKVLARDDIDTFCEFVLREDVRRKKGETSPELIDTTRGIAGRPIEQHRIHVEMQAAITNDRHVVILGHPESGKTVQVGVGRILHELGNDTARQYALVSNTQNAAKKTLAALKVYIERSEELRAVFPKLRPGSLWTTEHITVDRNSASRDPSVQTVGYHGDILGSRLDGIVGDDCLDFENTRNERARNEFDEWFRTTVLSRELEDAWCAFLTNAWHERDQVEKFAKDGWRVLRFPVMDEHGEPTWAKRWSKARIATTRKTLPRDFIRLFMCRPRSDEDKTFLPAAIEMCRELGRGYSSIERLPEWAEEEGGLLIVTGVDIGASKRTKGGKSVLSTIAVHPNAMMQPLAMRSSTKGGGAQWLFDSMSDVADRFGGILVVEDNGTQSMLVEIAQQRGEEIPIPVVPFQTGRNKVAPETGLATMAAEMEAGRWILPDITDDELEEFYADLDSYDPEAHTGDHLMATWMARTYARRLLRRRQRSKNEGVRAVNVGNGTRDAAAYREALTSQAKIGKDPVARALAEIELAKLRRRDEARAGAVTLEDLTVST